MARKATIKKITKAYVRTYSDNGQVKVYIEGIDSDGHGFRTEGDVKIGPRGVYRFGAHMRALISRAKREGVKLKRETW